MPDFNVRKRICEKKCIDLPPKNTSNCDILHLNDPSFHSVAMFAEVILFHI